MRQAVDPLRKWAEQQEDGDAGERQDNAQAQRHGDPEDLRSDLQIGHQKEQLNGQVYDKIGCNCAVPRDCPRSFVCRLKPWNESQPGAPLGEGTLNIRQYLRTRYRFQIALRLPRGSPQGYIGPQRTCFNVGLWRGFS
jgi:hypothetical protein